MYSTHTDLHYVGTKVAYAKNDFDNGVKSVTVSPTASLSILSLDLSSNQQSSLNRTFFGRVDRILYSLKKLSLVRIINVENSMFM